jgi:hypothetical protein
MPGKHVLRQLVRLPTRGETIRGVGTAILVALICWYFGVNVWHAILLGCASTVASFAVLKGAPDQAFRDVSWRHRSRSSRGSRNDVSTLAHSLRSGWEPIGLTAERRLRQIARHRLALEGLDLRNEDHREAIERRIGRRASRILLDSGKRPRLGSLVHCLDALDMLDLDHYAPPEPRSRWRVAHLIPSNLRRTRER